MENFDQGNLFSADDLTVIDLNELMFANIDQTEEVELSESTDQPLEPSSPDCRLDSSPEPQVDPFATSGNIPIRDDYPGRYNFSLSLDESTSGQQWVYSNKLNMLFIGMNKTLVMQFRMNIDWLRFYQRLYIVALPVYATDEHVNIPVNRCTFHSVEDDPQSQAHQQENVCLCGPENNYVGHVVRAGEPNAEYRFDRFTKRHSVRVPIAPPQVGCDHIPIPYSFACKTSCPRGMQRRPIHVIFTLEDEAGNIFGRQKMGIKVCSCPKRDQKRQEQDLEVEKRGEKRKRATRSNYSAGMVDYSDDVLRSIKLESIDVSYMQKSDAVDQIKLETAEAERMFLSIKNQLYQLMNKLNNIEELIEHYKY